MKILGINAGRAAPIRVDSENARPLADGSAALLVNGAIACAAIEERYTKVRYAGGFRQAGAAVLRSGDISLGSVDAIGLSTCCDSPWSDPKDIVDAVVEDLGNPSDSSAMMRQLRDAVHCVDHHDSHAMLSFIGSGFDRALVCTIDGFGNRRDDIGQFHVEPTWWQGSFDRQTYYLADWHDGKVRLKRVLESNSGADKVGLAELYRAVTHYLGWPSYQYAGKTMALAGYGDPSALPNLSFINQASGQVLLCNDHSDPTGQIEIALRQAGYEPPLGLTRPATPLQAWFANVAARLQRDIEGAIRRSIDGLVETLGVSQVAVAGGLAMNCVAMGKLANARPDLEFYIPSAPGDTGQGLGNALWLRHNAASPVATLGRPQRLDTAALGASFSAAAVESALAPLGSNGSFEIERLPTTTGMAQSVSNLIGSGAIVAACVGRSEYGPRALGCRSIFADVRDPDVKQKVNQVKRRESFRPFAASLLSEDLAHYYNGSTQSPFMSFAFPANDVTRKSAPGIVHVDGSTRVQTVRSDDAFLPKLLQAFRERTGVGLMLNTSFNLAGKPIVETPADAVDVFLGSQIDALVLGQYLVKRNVANQGVEYE
jgi:carbamoyltransferase